MTVVVFFVFFFGGGGFRGTEGVKDGLVVRHGIEGSRILPTFAPLHPGV